MQVKISFTQEPKKALAYLKSKDKKYQETFHYTEMMHQAHHKAFTVAKIANTDLLKDIHESLIHAQKNGLPFAQWKKNIKPTLQKKGWWGEVTAIDKDTGEVKDIYVGSRRLRTIFYTNMRTSYAVGRHQQQMALTDAVYWRYSAVLDSRTRPKHQEMHGIIKHRDDPWWNTNYPPNGWGCRCKVQALTRREMKRKGFKEVKAKLENIAEKDWAYNVGKADNIVEVLENKVKKLKPAIKKVALVGLGSVRAISVITEFMKSKEKGVHQEIGLLEKTPVFFSDYTRKKQLRNHPELSEIEYGYIPIMMASPSEKILNGKYRYYIKKIDHKEYLCVFKIIKGKNEVFLQSFRRTNSLDIKELRKREAR